MYLHNILYKDFIIKYETYAYSTIYNKIHSIVEFMIIWLSELYIYYNIISNLTALSLSFKFIQL